MMDRSVLEPADLAAPPARRVRTRSRAPGVRTYLLGLVTVCLLPVSVLAAVTLLLAYYGGQRALVEQATLESRAMVRTVDASLAGPLGALRAMAASPALDARDFVAFGEETRRALPYQPVDNIVLSDASGQQLVNVRSAPGQPLQPDGDRAFQQRVVAGGGAAVSDLLFDRALQHDAVAVAIPVSRAGHVNFTLAMGILPDRFAPLLTGPGLEPDRVVSVLDRRGVIIARSLAAQRYAGHKGVPALLQAMARRPEGVVETATLEGIPVIIAYTRSPLSGWTVAVGVPRQLLMARLERWTGWIAASGLVLLLLSVLAAQLLARRISAAFRDLIPAAQALGEGEPVRPVRLPVAEAEAVAEALSAASQLLQARTQERDAAAEKSASERMRAQHFAHAAQHDPLTGLFNRAQFVHVLDERLTQCRAHGTRLYVLFLDLDNFKPVNDRYGHGTGDELLRSFAARLHAGVRPDDVVGRLGGDEFAVLIGDHGVSDIRITAASLVERLSRPYAIRQLTLNVSASVGVAFYPEHGDTAQALLEAADAAMYQAKSAGKSGYTVSGFTPL